MKIAVLGDSLSSGYFLGGAFVADPNASYPVLIAQALGATQVAIAAQPGARIVEIAGGIGQLPHDADLLIVNAGTNDLKAIKDGTFRLAEMVAAWDGMVLAARDSMPNARIVAVGLRDYTRMYEGGKNEATRAAIADFNAHVVAAADALYVDVVDRPGAYDFALFPDTVHPSPLGVRWFTDAVLEALA